jgi:adenylate cyclase
MALRFRVPTPLAAGAALAMLVALFHLTGLAGALDRAWFDFLSRRLAEPASAHPEAVMVLIDEETVAAVAQRGERWPWPRERFAGLFAAIHQAGARAIAADLLFLEPSEDGAQDDVLASYTVATGTHLARLTGQVPALPSTAAQPLPVMGLVEYHPDLDGTVRRYAFPQSLAAVTLPREIYPHATPKLRWYGGTHALGRQALRAQDLVAEGREILAAVRASGADEFDPKSVRQALESLPPGRFRNELEGRTVFIGASHAAGFDLKPFPIGPREPGVLVHFTAWSNAVQGTWFRQAPGLGVAATIAILSGSLTLFWRQASLARLAWMAGGIILALLGSGVAGFAFHYWEPVALPVFATAAVFTTLAVRHWREESAAKRQLGDLFGSYVSPQVLTRLLEHPDRLRLGGECREVTVFFSDVAGFTELSEKVGPETLVAVMNDYLSEMSEYLIEQGGYLDKYIGDAIMGVFGAPEPQDGHALAACRAALSCRDRLHELAPGWEARHGVRLSARIGINSGVAVAGNVGSARKRNYTVLGDCVNLASRLEGANKAYGTTILIGEATAALVGDDVLTRPVDFLRVKGKSTPVRTYELLALAGSASPGQREQARAHTHAHALYQAQKFQDALESYQIILARDAGDHLAAVYRDRCRSFLDNPPPADWDGVYQLKDK